MSSPPNLPDAVRAVVRHYRAEENPSGGIDEAIAALAADERDGIDAGMSADVAQAWRVVLAADLADLNASVDAVRCAGDLDLEATEHPDDPSDGRTMSSPEIAAAVRLVLADYREQQDDPNASLAEAIASTRENLDHDDIDTLTRTDELGGPLMTAEVAAATRAVLDADAATIAEALAADGGVEVTDVGVAVETAGEQPVEQDGGVETVEVVEHADAAVACATAAAAAAQAAADAHAAGDTDAVGVVVVEDLRAPCDADAY